MNVALVTTTIHTPKVLKLYQRYIPNGAIFIAADRKTPAAAAELSKQQGWNYLSPAYQESAYPHLSDFIGWNTIGRRNIAILEALRAGADIIVLSDDDNIPLASGYFHSFLDALTLPFDGPQVHAPFGWFDVGQLLDPVAPHRGYPLEVGNAYEIETAIDAKVGVAAGICLGDPDISAITRIAHKPVVHRASALLDAGVVVSPSTYTVFNSQNTAFLAPLAAAFLMLPQLGRYDDIFASLVAQKVMKKLKLQVHFGKPFVWQQRNSHNLITDMSNEMWGYKNFWKVSELTRQFSLNLNDNEEMPLPRRTIDLTRQLYVALAHHLPDGCLQLAHLWIAELEKIYAAQKEPVAA